MLPFWSTFRSLLQSIRVGFWVFCKRVGRSRCCRMGHDLIRRLCPPFRRPLSPWSVLAHPPLSSRMSGDSPAIQPSPLWSLTVFESQNTTCLYVSGWSDPSICLCYYLITRVVVPRSRLYHYGSACFLGFYQLLEVFAIEWQITTFLMFLLGYRSVLLYHWCWRVSDSVFLDNYMISEFRPCLEMHGEYGSGGIRGWFLQLSCVFFVEASWVR